MAWVEKDHNAHLIPMPCYVQGHQPADQAAQSHIQPGLECLQGWGIHNVGFRAQILQHRSLVKIPFIPALHSSFGSSSSAEHTRDQHHLELLKSL